MHEAFKFMPEKEQENKGGENTKLILKTAEII